MPQISDLLNLSNPQVKDGERKADYQLAISLQQYFAYRRTWQGARSESDVRPVSRFFLRFAEDLFDVYAKELIRRADDPADFMARCRTLIDHLVERILPDPSRKISGSHFAVIRGTERRVFADASGTWEGELLSLLEGLDQHYINDYFSSCPGGSDDDVAPLPWYVVTGLRDPDERRAFEDSLREALRRRLEHWKGQLGEHEPRPSSAAEHSVVPPGPTSQEVASRVSTSFSANDKRLLDFIDPEMFRGQTDSQIAKAWLSKANRNLQSLGRSKKFTQEAFRSALKRIRHQLRLPSSKQIKKKSVNPDTH